MTDKCGAWGAGVLTLLAVAAAVAALAVIGIIANDLQSDISL